MKPDPSLPPRPQEFDLLPPKQPQASPSSCSDPFVSPPTVTTSLAPTRSVLSVSTGNLVKSNPIPPPLTLVPQDHSDPSSFDQDHVMTARCSQFPIQSIFDHHPHHPSQHRRLPPTTTPTSATAASPSSSLGPSCRFQPYLHHVTPPSLVDPIKPPLPAAPSWPSPNPAGPDQPHPPPLLQKASQQPRLPHPTHPGTPNPSHGLAISTSATNPSASPVLALDSPLSSSDLNSSCSSSLASSSHPSCYFSSSSLGFSNDPSASAPNQASGRNRSDSSVFSVPPPVAYPQPPSYTSFPAPPPQANSQRLSLSLAYPTAAFTPSGGSPPLTTCSSTSPFFHIDGAGRRHTLSSFASPSSVELGLVGNIELDENYIREEKRRRNKESSQRFRDRTRERQREKQERLDYLERRTKELEVELVATRTRFGGSRSEDSHAPVKGEHDSVVESLRRENEGLRSALKRADEEIFKLRELAAAGGNSSRHETSSHRSFDIRQVCTSLAQLSPPASTGIGSSSQSSSPGPEYSQLAQSGSSPESDTHPTHRQLGGMLQNSNQISYPQLDAGQNSFQVSNANGFCWPAE